jgi:phosphopantothenoylcysteine decarboxylase
MSDSRISDATVPAATGDLVVVATGSIVSVMLPSYLQEIRALTPVPLTVVLTHSALRFVSAEVAGWFADRVVVPDQPGVNPVELATKARAVACLPATGNTIATAALGLMPTTASTVLGVAAGPVLYFPQMHEQVWRGPVMQRHLSALREAGHVVVDPQTALSYRMSEAREVESWTMPAPDEAAELLMAWLESLDRCSV